MFDVEYSHTKFKTESNSSSYQQTNSTRKSSKVVLNIFFTLISPPLIIIKWLGKIKILISEVII